jgi:hypothetical protein
MPNNKYGALDKGKSFGPGHDGWYAVSPRLKNVIFYRKAKSAFQATAKAGLSLVEAVAVPITDEDTINKLNTGELK